MQALIDYNSQHLPELRLLYHNSARCKWTFSHNLNFLRKKPFIFIKNYTFYFGKYITTYYLLMCRILQFPICVATETPLRIVVVGLPESIFQTRSRFSNFIPEPSSFNDSVALIPLLDQVLLHVKYITDNPLLFFHFEYLKSIFINLINHIRFYPPIGHFKLS